MTFLDEIVAFDGNGLLPAAGLRSGNRSPRSLKMNVIAQKTASNAAAGRARPVQRVVRGIPDTDGAGVKLTRLIGQPALRMLDPFLMLDHFGSDVPGDYIAGFPSHPHRGFQTVTYMYAGRMRHSDNRGNVGVIGPGDVQWMSAGRGIVHSEMPEQENGLLSGSQLWINLPARLKMSPPRYQDFPARQMADETRPGIALKIVAGITSLGTRGPVVDAGVDAFFFDARMDAGATLNEPLPPGHTAFFYVVSGAVEPLDEAGKAGEEVPHLHIAVLGAGDHVSLRATQADTRLLLIGGCPLNEPVVASGPFVMNSQAEIQQAISDYRAGLF